MSDSDTQIALRDLSGKVGALDATVKTLLEIWKNQETSASMGRRVLHEKLEVVSKEVSTLNGKVERLDDKVETVISDVAVLAPSVKAFDNARQQAKGAQTLGKIIWGLIGLGGLGAGWVLANWISITPKFPPPH